jgi:hypothetical protein
MRDHMTLGPVPCDEPCAQVGEDDYPRKSRDECKRYVALLERKFPNAPDGTYFGVKSFPHDFGTYREVCVFFDDEDEKSTGFALKVEANTPMTWDDDKPVMDLGILA